MQQLSSNLTCGSVGSAPFDLPYASNITCTAEYQFSQETFEAGLKLFTARFNATPTLAVEAVSNEVEVAAARAAGLHVDMPKESCTLPRFAGNGTIG